MVLTGKGNAQCLLIKTMMGLKTHVRSPCIWEKYGKVETMNISPMPQMWNRSGG